jgi:hypothetical protein
VHSYEELVTEDLMETYSSEYSQWEEVVARRLFSAHGVTADRIAASMHQYVEKARDTQAMELIDLTQRALKDIVLPPSVVELHPFIEAAHIASTVRRVVAALRNSFAGISIDLYKDTNIESSLGITALKRRVSAFDVASTKGCLSGTDELQSALDISLSDDLTMRLTPSQFHAYLDVFSATPELEEVLRELALPAGMPGVRLLRGGVGQTFNLTANPVVVVLLQLDINEHLRTGLEDGVDRYFDCVEAMGVDKAVRAALADEYWDVDTAGLDAALDRLALGSLVLPVLLYCSLLCGRYGIYMRRIRSLPCVVMHVMYNCVGRR